MLSPLLSGGAHLLTREPTSHAVLGEENKKNTPILPEHIL